MRVAQIDWRPGEISQTLSGAQSFTVKYGHARGSPHNCESCGRGACLASWDFKRNARSLILSLSDLRLLVLLFHFETIFILFGCVLTAFHQAG